MPRRQPHAASHAHTLHFVSLVLGRVIRYTYVSGVCRTDPVYAFLITLNLVLRKRQQQRILSRHDKKHNYISDLYTFKRAIYTHPRTISSYKA